MTRSAELGMLFDAYLIVDWNAHSKLKLGEDSIWLAYREDGTILENTGRSSRTYLRDIPRVHESRNYWLMSVSRSRRVLVGLDFPYGYPEAWRVHSVYPETPRVLAFSSST